MKKFEEVSEALDRKLNIHQYLIDNTITEVDLLVYSYLKIIQIFNELEPMNILIHKHSNLRKFFIHMNDKFGDTLKKTFPLFQK